MFRVVSRISMALVAAMMVGFAGIPIEAQPAQAYAAAATSRDTRPDTEFPDRRELDRRIALYETAQKSGERSNLGLQDMLKVYSNLAGLYEDASLYPQAEAILHKEIAMLRNGPQDELARALTTLAVLHIGMGDFHQAEKDEAEVMRIRESLGDPVGIALTWSDFGDIEVKERHYQQALESMQKAMVVLTDNPRVDVGDWIAAQQTLASALCGLERCGEAIVLLKDSLETQKRAYGADSLLVGSGTFLLGAAYWHHGDMDQAADLMAKGMGRMKVDLGWGHSIYLSAMSEYAKFLRQRGRKDAAESAEREIRTANAVVDARSLAPRSTAFSAGSR